MNLNGVLRQAILAATHQPAVARFMRRHGMRLGASRFVAGESLDECVRVLHGLEAQGFWTNTTLLGEGVHAAAAAAAVTAEYQRILDRLKAERLRTNVALKLTHLGLNLGQRVARENLETLVRYAAARGNFIRIDMEESRHVDAALDSYRALRAAGHENVGCVLQAYLHRSAADLRALLPLRPNLRLVKGAYLEPAGLAWQNRADIDRNYLRLAQLALPAAEHTCIATHDARIIEAVIDFAEQHGLSRQRYEFQMLYGVRPRLQLELVRRGFKVLVATPFGPEWYFYLMRRLAERPANVMLLVRSLGRRAKGAETQ